MNHSLIVKPGLLLIILTIEFLNYSPVQAGVREAIPQNQKQLKQQSSQQIWEQFRRQQDEVRLRQQQRSEQFRLQNKLRQQPLGQSRIDQLRQQQRREMDTFKLQQKFRQQQ
ncbi:hypothetical protein IQ276_008145 [Desmonostoc muscorum LEGE 12446]|uniref:Uncharacterized protein n=1 Tax=Desmonostoc muscorum LEGE 12446 TaxID=1828758 RepID=A0A8J7AIM9_DESMC|nr:hypothetical protein [Desmonostoc muscorum]MCF2146420.1 hypothetical protein [Desmonostoc muscorum LEGE 12446]